MPASPRTPRPVYILGAGFSKAIHKAMPITNALGDELQRRLAGKVTIDLRDGQTFEAWLTAMLDPMPFLSQAEVLARRSAAALVTQTIADILDEAQAKATADPAPDWLLQLVSLWHAEGAVIITFNYDCLVEHAINTAGITVGYSRESADVLRGMDAVSPAPPRQESLYWDDGNSNLAFESMTLVKLHGSLNWYRADGDGFGSTLFQTFDYGKFNGETPSMPRGNPEFIAHMDRFIIPPVSDKSQHYGAYVVPTLWKTARDAMSVATRVTFMGYSLPPEDRVSVELMTYCPEGVETVVVDRTKFNPECREALPNRLKALGLNVVSEISGDDAIARMVTLLMEAAQIQLSGGTRNDAPAPLHDCYVAWVDTSELETYPTYGFHLLTSDDTDPSVLYAVPVRRQGILSERKTFQTNLEEDFRESGLDPSNLITESAFRRLVNKGAGVRINPNNGSTRHTVVGVQHVNTHPEIGGFIALHTIEGDFPRPNPDGSGVALPPG
ncbi:hypothetical protein ACP3TD_11640 [Pseudarthrobacter sp. 1G09]|uniref:hypothetical protein n=1 Tax=Pseudarthrobacter sp. 1G09 TaxID=3416178 RepID=UPI003CECE475